MTKLILYSGNTSEVRFAGIQNADTLAFLTGCTVTCSLYTPAGVAVTGATNLSMADVTGIPGTVNCFIPSSVTIPEGNYYLTFDGTTPSGDAFSWYQPVEVRTRQS
jgi:hypothetical protein